MCYNSLDLRGITRYYSEEQLKVEYINPRPFGDNLPSSNYLQDFKNSNSIFVDKTDIIHKLINNGGANLLTRPKGFGKSLLLDTIQMIFEKDKIIKLLKIGQHYENLIPHPVIRFDFSADSDLKGYIWNILNHHAVELKISIADLSIQASLMAVLKGYSKINKQVCILVDEYDEPLWVDDENLLKINKQLIEHFFLIVKSLEEHIRFMLVLGVTTNSLWYENNWWDITLDLEYATLLGFTLEDIKIYFSNHIDLLAKSSEIKDTQTILETMTKLYDGFQFSYWKTPGLYHPISVIECFKNKQLKKYWTATSDGSYSKLLRAFKNPSFRYHIGYDAQQLDSIDPCNANLTQLLWQTGYLTIKDSDMEKYYLRVTNEEIEDQFDSIKYTIL